MGNNNYSFIIGTDLNINIYNPDLDYYDDRKESIKKPCMEQGKLKVYVSKQSYFILASLTGLD